LVVFFFVVFFSSFSWGPQTPQEEFSYLDLVWIIPYHCWIAPWLFQALSHYVGPIASPSCFSLPILYHGISWLELENLLYLPTLV
jgi:hypothetical protein